MLRHSSYRITLGIADHREDAWRLLLSSTLDSLQISNRLLKTVKSLTIASKVPTYLPISNRHVRNASRIGFVDALSREFIVPHDSRLYFVTLAGSRGETSFIRPQFDMAAFQAAADAFLRHRHLSGIFSFEFDVIRRPGPAADHIVLFHCHGVVRSDASVIPSIETLKGSFATSPAFPAWNGAVGAHIKYVGVDWLDIHRVAVYLADPFHQLKRLQPLRNGDGQKLRSTRDGMTRDIIMWATEIQSHLSVRDTVFGVGALGKQLRANWWTSFQAALPRQAAKGALIEPGAVPRLWRQIRRADGSDSRYSEIAIRTRSSAYRSR